jgi:hypothetical protein
MAMNIFQMRTLPHGIERFQQFINEQFVCIGWPGLGDLSSASKDELRERIATILISLEKQPTT